MKDKKKMVPEIRFKGFEDDWEQRKLRDVTERVRGNDGRMDLPTLTISAGSGWLDQRERFSGNIAGKEQKNYTLLRKGELSYNHGNSKLAKYGAVFELRTYEEALVPRVYHSFKSTDASTPDFIEYMFATKRPDRELAKLVSSGARMDGLLNINFDAFMGIKIALPTADEQTKISELFRKLDDTIVLHQRKYDILKSMKQEMLQNLFPTGQSEVPEIRFTNFNKVWEQRMLKEISNKVTEKNKNNKFTETFTNSAEYGIISQREFFDKDISNKKNLNGYYIVRKDDFVYNPRISNYAPVGPIKRNKLGRTGIMSPLYYVFRTFDINQSFLEYYFETTGWHRFMKLNGDSGARADRFAIRNSIFETMSIPYPSFMEQENIGAFFNKFNEDITLRQRKITELTSLKKELLKRLFV